MVNFKDQSSMKQYVKNKQIKWGFKFQYRCASETRSLYQFVLPLGKKESAEENMGPGLVLNLTEFLQNSHSFLDGFFDNFFKSPSLIVNLYIGGLCGIGTSERIGKEYRKCLLTER